LAGKDLQRHTQVKDTREETLIANENRQIRTERPGRPDQTDRQTDRRTDRQTETERRTFAVTAR
jgi:hypothetical protein